MTSFYPNRSSKNCVFCHEEGHHIKACTVLATNECGYCHNLGHTTRRCPILANRDQNRRRSSSKKTQRVRDVDGFIRPKSTFQRRVTKQPSVATGHRLSTFSVLSNAEPKRAVKVAVPTTVKQRAIQGSWKVPLKAERVPPKKVAKVVPMPKKVAKVVPMPKKVAKSVPPPMPNRRYIGSWADAADSESDDDVF